MKLILLGAPGAGKGTLAKLLSAVDGSVQISSGDLLRADRNSELGRRARDFMQRGELVPDELIIGMMEKRLQHADCQKGFLLDGFPRTIPQAESLNELFDKLNVRLDLAVNLEVAREELLARLTTRRTCVNPDCQEIYNIKTKPPKVAGICDKCGGDIEQRADETEAAIDKRLKMYAQKTAPLIEFYRQRDLLFSTDLPAGDEAAAAVIARLQL